MTDTPRDERGRWSPENADEEFIEAVREHEPAGTREVAEAVGVTRQNADQRLRRLEGEGRIRNKKIGRELVWMLADNE